MVQKKFQKTIERCIKKATQFNERLQQYIDTTGDDELPEIDCTCIGFSVLSPYTWEETENGVVFDCDGIPVRVEQEYEDGEWYLGGVEELAESIKYDDRRIRKAWKVWRAENPDEELEKMDEDNED